MGLEYDDKTGLIWANGSKRSRVWGFPSFLVVPVFAWLLVPPFTTFHLIIWSVIIIYMDVKKLTLRELIGRLKIWLIRGRMTITNRREYQRRSRF